MFSKAKRFNVMEDCVPPVGSYDPKQTNNPVQVPSFSKSDRKCSSDATLSPASSVQSVASLDRRTFVTPRPVRANLGQGTPNESSAKIKELEREIRRLLADRCDLLKKLASKEDEARKLDFKLQAVIKEKQSVLSSLASFQRETKDIRRQNEILTVRVMQHEAPLRKKDPVMQLANLKAIIAGKDHEIDDLRNEVSDVRSQYEQIALELGGKNDYLRSGTEELDTAIATLRAEVALARQEAADLRDSNVRLEKNKEDLFDKMMVLESKQARNDDSTQLSTQHKEKLLEDLLECRSQLEQKEEASARIIDTLRSENLAILLRVEEQTGQRRVQEKLLATELDNAYQKLATSEDCSKSLQEYRDSLVHRLSFLKESVAELEAQQITDMASIRELKTELKTTSALLSKKERALLDANRKITDLDEQVRNLLENEEVIRDLQDECKRLGEELMEMESSNKIEVDKVEGELLIAELTLQNSQKEESALRQIVSELRQELFSAKESEKEVHELRSAMDHLKAQAESREENLKSELDCVNETLSCQNGRCQDYEDAAKAAAEEGQRLATALEAETAELRHLSEALSTKTEEVTVLNATLASLTEVIDQTGRELSDALEEAGRTRAALQMKTDEHRELEVTLAAKVEELSEVNEETELLQTELGVREAHIARLESSAVARSAEVEKLQSDLRVRLSEVERLEDAVSLQSKEVAKLTADCRLLAILVEEREDTIARLTESVNYGADNLTSMEAERDDANLEVARLVALQEEKESQLVLLRLELAHLRDLCEEKAAAVLLADGSLIEAREQLAARDVEVSNLRIRIDEREEAVASTERQLVALQAELAERDSLLVVVRADLATTMITVVRLGEELTVKSLELEQLDADAKGRNAALEELSVRESEMAAELAALREEVLLKSSHLDELRAELAKKDASLELLLNEVSEKDSKLEKVSEEAFEKNAALGQLREEVHLKEGMLTQLDNVISEQNVTLAELRKAIIERDDKLDRCGQEILAREEVIQHISEKDSRLDELVNAISTRDAELDELRSTVDEQCAVVDDLRHRLSKKESELDQLGVDVAAKDVRLDELAEAVVAKNAELGELKVVLRRNEELNAHLEANAGLVADLAVAREQLENLLQHDESQQALIAELESENESAMDRIRQLDARIKKYVANAEWHADRERDLLAELTSAEERISTLEQSYHDAEAELDIHRRTKEAEGRDNERLLQALTDEYETKMRSRLEELAATKTDAARWKARFEQLQAKVEPFMEQINAFEMERQLLVGRTREATSDLQKLSQDYAKLLGHQNHKQKIHYVAKMKEDYLAVKEENAKLWAEVLKHRSTLRKQGGAGSVQRFDSARAFQHDKENGTPLQARKFDFN